MTDSEPGLTRPTRMTAAEQVAEALFDGILAGTIRPGTPLRLQELSEQMGTSMMPVREAVRRLEALGMVEIRPHKGAWVRPLTRADLLDTYFARTNLETLAIREAARRFDAADAERARIALAEQQAARASGDQVRARGAHERFHFALYEASGSNWLMRSIVPAWRNSERYRVESMRHANAEARYDEHNKILEALVERDAERAVACLARHLQTSIDLVFEALPTNGDEDVDKPENVTGQFLRGTS